MKKQFKYLSIAFYSLIALTLVSCPKPINPTYESEWTHDEYLHYHKGQGEYSEYKQDLGNHTFSEWVVTKNATVSEEGTKERTCRVCGYKETKKINKIEEVVSYTETWSNDNTFHWHHAVNDEENIIDHSFHHFNSSVTDATCLDDGYTTFVCEECGYTFRSNYTKALGHDYDTYDVIVSPTENTIGYVRLICSRDNNKVAISVPKLNDTDYELTTTPSTCDKEGKVVYSLNDISFVTFETSLPKAAHSYGEWIVDKEATENEDGMMHHVCENCSFIEQKTIYALSHEHTFASEWVYDKDNPDIGHYHTATCGHTEVLGDLSDHEFEVVNEVNPTCKEEGYKIYRCTVCGYTYKGDYADVLSHQYNEYEIIETPTEIKTGIARGKCSLCAEETEMLLPKLSEVNYNVTTTKATCQAKGEVTYSLKSNPEIIIKIELPIGSHNYEVKEKVNPTCSEKGYTVYECSICHTTKNDNYVDALGHDFVVTETIDPTCTEKGYSNYECSRCHETKVDDYTDALGHDYVYASINWNDENHTAKALYICSRDNNHKVEYDCEISTVTATEKEDGSKCVVTLRASYDGHTDDNTYELDHTYGNWTITKEATQTEDGSKERICTVCNHKETAVIDRLPDTSLTDDLVKSGIYTGDYYNYITSNLYAYPSILELALTELINTNYVRFSYSGETGTVGKLKIVDSYDLDYVECIYTGQRIEKTNSGSNTGAWNKEHVWAKSHGFNDEKYDAYSDMHHLRVSEANINSNRSNSYFDVVTSPTSTDTYGNKWTTTVFEPRDEVKGDIARMLMYMVVKYNGTYAKDGLNLDLELTNDSTLIYSESNTGAGTYGGTHYLGILSTLVKWHYQDPVDEREIFRNNEIFKLQKNRNPFIDHPEYVYYLYPTESQSYITEANLSSLDSYISSNATAIAALEAEVESLGTITLDDEDTINDILTKYDALGQVSKSFFKKYRAMMEAKNELDRLKSYSSQDKTISTEISFKNLSNTTGNVVNNGVSVDYVASGNNADFGIYAQGTAQGTNPAVLTVSGLYSNIKSLTFNWTTNHSAEKKDGVVVVPAGATATVTITDGTTTRTYTSTDIINTTSKTNVSTFTIGLSEFDLSKVLTITVKNNVKSSVRIKTMVFNV